MWLTLLIILEIVLFIYLPHFVLCVPLIYHFTALGLYWVVAFQVGAPRENYAFRTWSGWRRLFPTPLGLNSVPVDQQYLYAVHPHGVYSVGVILGFALNPRTAHVKIAASSLLFAIPVVRELVRLGGAIPANAVDISAALCAGHSVVIASGGLRARLGSRAGGEWRGCSSSGGLYPARKWRSNCSSVGRG